MQAVQNLAVIYPLKTDNCSKRERRERRLIVSHLPRLQTEHQENKKERGGMSSFSLMTTPRRNASSRRKRGQSSPNTRTQSITHTHTITHRTYALSTFLRGWGEEVTLLLNFFAWNTPRSPSRCCEVHRRTRHRLAPPLKCIEIRDKTVQQENKKYAWQLHVHKRTKKSR